MAHVLRSQVPDFVVAEMYAELSGRFHAVSTWVLRAVRRWLWRLISGWCRGFGNRYPVPFMKRNDPVSAPVVWALGIQERGIMSTRSPPESPRSSARQPFHADLPIGIGRVDVRLDASVMMSWDASPSLSLTPQADNEVQRTDGSQQAAA